MTSKLGTELGELDSLAHQLRGAADGMDSVGTSPAAPDAGDSTAVVAAFMESVCRSSAALTETASKSSGDVTASKATYGSNEGSSASAFDNLK